VICGEMFDPKGALQAGFFDKVVAPEELTEAARTVALQMKKINMRAHKQTKLKVRKEFLETLDRAIELDRQIPL